MTTVLKASPRRFVATPAIERLISRALRYLQAGYSIHLRGPAGTGKTTLALHLADLLSRPIMLMFGDDEFKTSDLIGNQRGYTRKKVVDNFIHSVVKIEDELRQNWVDSRLTLACKDGFTLVYDEFNRSRPEVNNVLLSALEEKLLVLPPSSSRSEYVRVNPYFRAILTSNPEEYHGVHATQDALLDRIITINIPEPDELTQQEIAVHKTGIDRESALLIVRLVKAFRAKTGAEKTSGLRSCLMLAKICHEHEVMVMPENSEFRDICQDILLSRVPMSWAEATPILWDLFNEMIATGSTQQIAAEFLTQRTGAGVEEVEPVADRKVEDVFRELMDLESGVIDPVPQNLEGADVNTDSDLSATALPDTTLDEQAVYEFLQQQQEARQSEIEQALSLKHFRVTNALKSLTDKGLVIANGNHPKSSYRIYAEAGEA